MRDYDTPLAQPLIDFCQEHFDCETGPPRAYFELPQRDANDPVRLSYVVYAVQGPTYEACEKWLLENVFEPLEKEACDEARLYWRLEDMIQVETFRDHVRVRTRLAVLDKNLNQVYIADKVVTEGRECPSVEA